MRSLSAYYLFSWIHFYLLQIPDVLCVLLDCSVTAEFTCTQRVKDRHLGPLLLVFVCLVHHLLGCNVWLEISTHQICIIVVCYSSHQLHQQLLLTESTCSDGLDDLLQLSRNIFLGSHSGHFMPQLLNFLNPSAKDKDVILTNFLINLNISSIHSSKNQTSIHNKLHIASSRSLCSCSRDMLTQLRSRYNDLCIRHIIVW